MAESTNVRPVRFGRVLSTKMQKTVVVAIERFEPHPRYRKIRRRITRLKAHDERSECKVGDRVKLQETRPLSKEKRWRVVKIMQEGEPEQ